MAEVLRLPLRTFPNPHREHMGIKFLCPNGHKMNVKSFLAGKKGICPKCGTKVDIPLTGDDGHADGADVSMPAAATPAANAPTFGMVVPNQPAAMPAAMPAALPNGMSAPLTGALPMPQPMPVPGYAAPGYPVQPAMPMSGLPSAAPLGGPVAAAVVPAHLQPVAAVPVAPAPEPVAPRDAIAEAPQASWHVRPPSGGQFGPARGDMMREWISQGRVTADSLVWREGWNDWQKADAVFPSLKPAGAAAGGASSGEPAREKNELEALVRAPSSPTLRVLPRRKSKDAIMLFSVLLFVVVAILALVLGYVLMKNNQRRNQPTTTEVVPVGLFISEPEALATNRGTFSSLTLPALISIA